jgi:hypothetical protein
MAKIFQTPTERRQYVGSRVPLKMTDISHIATHVVAVKKHNNIEF